MFTKKSATFQFRKVLNLNFAIDNVGIEVEEIKGNLLTAISVLVIY